MSSTSELGRRTRSRALRWGCAGVLSLAAHLAALVILIQTPDGVRPPVAPSVEVTLVREPPPEPEREPPPGAAAVVRTAVLAPAAPPEPVAAAPAIAPPSPSGVAPGAPPMSRPAEASTAAQPGLKLGCAEVAMLPASLRPMGPCDKQTFPRAGSLDRRTFALTPDPQDAMIAARKASRRQDPGLSPQGQLKANGPCQGANLGIGCPPDLPFVIVHAGGAALNDPDVPPPLIGK